MVGMVPSLASGRRKMSLLTPALACSAEMLFSVDSKYPDVLEVVQPPKLNSPIIPTLSSVRFMVDES